MQMVICMNIFDNMVVTEVEKPQTVFSEKGRQLQMDNRPCYGLTFCISGQISYVQDGRHYVSNPSCAVLLPRGASYSLYGDKSGLFPLINFQCDHLACDRITVLPLNNPKSHISKFKKLSNCFLYGDNTLQIYSLFYDLLAGIVTEQTLSENPLYPIIDYLREHIGDPELTNTVLAERLGVSEVYLRRLFTTYCGTTPKQYILTLRIEKAKQLLTDNQHSVTTIAEKCGFSSLYHFCRCFKERTGYTPLEYAGSHIIDKI